MVIAGSDWKDGDVAALRKLWDAGRTASEIAAELGGRYSRSAILGKVHRLNLPPRRCDNARMPVGQPSTPRAPRPRPVPAPQPQQRRNPSNHIVEKLKIAALEPGLSEKLQEPSDGKGVKLVDLENHHCRWPKGDPRDEEFLFCGEAGADFKESRPYCPFHTLKSVDRTRLRNPKAFERDAVYAARR